MLGVAEKKKAKPEPKRHPSRDKVRYVALPLLMHRALKGVGKQDDRSVSYMTRKAVRMLLEQLGQWPNPSQEVLELADQDEEDEEA